ncbi:hypothetical protein AG0111_0g9459 [Alternaria gaisen]|uniref:Uncharacterized protein n=1 Tax=Alternaria gaisen TaxID=167740 RepID=A0ACB6FBK8_9PLEO|nr:hypothetical protein AG0111_0g9459 [Alternaria gaisen]
MFFFLILDLIAAVSQARARVLQIRDLSQCAVSLNRPNSRFDATDLRKRLCIEYQGETSDCGIEDPNCSCANSQHPGVDTCLTNQSSESEVLQALNFLNDTCHCTCEQFDLWDEYGSCWFTTDYARNTVYNYSSFRTWDGSPQRGFFDGRLSIPDINIQGLRFCTTEYSKLSFRPLGATHQLIG